MQVAVVPEGASDVNALPGLIRLVTCLWQDMWLSSGHCNIVVDSGTGTCAIGAERFMCSMASAHPSSSSAIYCDENAPTWIRLSLQAWRWALPCVVCRGAS